MKKLIFSLLFFIHCQYIQSQVWGLSTGMNFIPERLIFKEATHNYPRPFFMLGLNYSHPNGVVTSLTYTFDVHCVVLTSIIPLWNVDKKKHNAFAILNNRKWE